MANLCCLLPRPNLSVSAAYSVNCTVLIVKFSVKPHFSKSVPVCPYMWISPPSAPSYSTGPGSVIPILEPWLGLHIESLHWTSILDLHNGSPHCIFILTFTLDLYIVSLDWPSHWVSTLAFTLGLHIWSPHRVSVLTFTLDLHIGSLNWVFILDLYFGSS